MVARSSHDGCSYHHDHTHTINRGTSWIVTDLLSYDGCTMIVQQSATFIRFELILLFFFTIFMYSISFQNTGFGVLQNTSKHFLISICIPYMERRYLGTPGCNKRFPRIPPKRIILLCILTRNGIIRLLPYRTYRLMLVRGQLKVK